MRECASECVGAFLRFKKIYSLSLIDRENKQSEGERWRERWRDGEKRGNHVHSQLQASQRIDIAKL